MKMFNRFKFLYFCKQFGESYVFGFLSLYFVKYGFTNAQAGALIGIIPLVMLFSTPLIGLLDDGKKRQKTIIIIAMALTGLVTLLFTIPNRTYLFMLVLVVIISFVRSPITPSIDSMATVTAINANHQFSEIRVMSSVGYIFAMSFGGMLADKIGFVNVLMIGAGFFLLTSLLVAFISVPSILDASPTEKEQTQHASRKQLMKNTDFLTFVAVSILSWSVFNCLNSFESIYFNIRFNNASMFGYIEGIRVIFEVTAMLVMTAIKRKLSVKWLLVFFQLTVFARALVNYFDMPFWTVIVSSCFIGFGFGVALYFNVQYLTTIVRKHNIHIAIFFLTSAQQLFNAIYTYISSALIDGGKFNNIYIFYCAVLCAGLIVTLIGMRAKPPRIDNSTPTVDTLSKEA